jgi:malonate-semialdehyde dehydrogenase (acetylating)/methylmalonate-semialdehyde dehydrogenase
MNRLIFSKNFSTKVLKNFINGQFVESKGTKLYDITDPSTNKVISQVPESTNEEFNQAVASSKVAFKSWRNVPVLNRQRYIFDYLRLLRERQVNLIKIG